MVKIVSSSTKSGILIDEIFVQNLPRFGCLLIRFISTTL